MLIRVYGKVGCGLCIAAKQKLAKLNKPYEDCELEHFTKHHEGWREDGSVEVLAAYSEKKAMPLIQIDGVFYDYPGAMSKLKKEQHSRKEGA